MVYCEVCGSEMQTAYKKMTQKEHKEFYVCKKCGLRWAPFLDIDSSFVSDLNEKEREKALGGSRDKEFEAILSSMDELIPKGGKGLEVGCAYGWFLDCTKDLYEMVGIEAEDATAAEARKKGHQVITGLFPQDMPVDKYDFLIFNNVWEHINHTTELIDACRDYLKQDGYVIFTIPLSTGAIYKTASVFEKLGRTNELVRLWQLHFHSPHIYYFNKENITALMKKHDFELVTYERVDSIDVNNMKARFKMDKNEKFAGIKSFAFRLYYFFAKRMAEDKATFYFKYRGNNE